MRLTEFSNGGGCGCKIESATLHQLLQQASILSAVPPQLTVGAHTADDAAVWQLDDTHSVIATTDFFSPLVDEPHDFGAIAATNAISDIYAMGGKPLFALALAAMPQNKLDADAIAAIFSGGREQCERAGIVVAGGHSIYSEELIYGLAVIGTAHPDNIITNTGAQSGDTLLLSKPLGIGVLSAALRQDKLSGDEYSTLLQLTTQLNSAGSEMGQIDGVHAMTDVTGFGLLGHLSEICTGSKLGAQLNFAALPLIDAAINYARQDIKTGATERNWRNVVGKVKSDKALTPCQQTLLNDPQTSGGLLVACTPDSVSAVQAVFARHGQRAVVIGEMCQESGLYINNTI